MRTSFDPLTWEIMDVMADDWESLDQIVPQVERFHGETNLTLIATLIVELISEGLVRVMKLQSNHNLTTEMILRDPIEYWFEMTPAGRALWESEGSKHCDG